MAVERSQVEELFESARGRSPGVDRAAYLNGVCGGNAELRAEVESLLKANDEASGFLPTIDGPSPADAAFVHLGEGPGTTIGRYRLLQQIGEGGFGTVFLAEQEQPVRRKVALKIIKPGMDTRQVIARFEGERQALAIMDHPNIAKVLDGGATETGRPYFVMELVRGVPITDYCDTNNLAVPERLDLFVQVCQAVQHAHQKGIIHRDLKPSNVMVMMADGKPTPKVIDFGIAKATDQRLTEKTVFTEFRQMIGTLEYMSPEQAEMAGIDIDTRSDIYSLGVLLYELLVGSTPFDPKELRSKAYAEMQRIIREVEPPRPSTKLSNSGDSLPSIAAHRRIDPVKLRQMLHGELDWIVMRALEKDRTRRYETANGLAKDVRRYLADEPVEACPPSTAYRLQKLLRRHRRPVLAGGLMLLAILIGAGLSIWQAVRATLAETRAVAERDDKEAARALLATQKQLAERLAGEKSELAQSARAQAVELRHRLTQNLFDLGWSQFAQGNLPQAMAILAGAYDKAAEADPLRASIATVMGAWIDRAPIYLPHKAAVVAVGFSPDGSTALTGSYDKTARLWDAKSGKPLGEPLQHAAFVRAVAFSPDGSTVLTGSADGKAHLWDARTGKPRGEPLQHQGAIWAVAYSPDGSILLTGSADGTARLWDARTTAPRGVPMKHGGQVRTVAYSPDGLMVLTGSTDWSVRLWDARTQQPVGKRMKHNGWISAAVFSPDGSKVLTASYDRTARLWDAKSGDSVARPMKHNGWVVAAVFSPDGSTLITGSQEGIAQFWDARTAQSLGEPLRHDGPVRVVVYSPDGSTALTGSLDGTARLWDARTGRPLGEPTKQNGGIVAAAFSPDGSRFLTGSNDPAALLCDMRTLKPMAVPMRHDGRVFLCVAYSSDGSTVLTGGADHTARLWDARTGKPLVEPMRHPQTVNAVAYSPDGSLVLTGCVDGRARLWDTRTGKPVGERMDHNGRSIRAVAYSPDGSTVLTGGEDNSARLWDTRTCKPVGAPMKHGGPINAVVYSPDGSMVLTGSDDKSARIWDAHTGKPLTEAMKNSGKVMLAVAFSPDGSRVVTASMDGTACLWDTRTGKPLGERMKHQGPAWAAAYSPDGAMVVTGSQDRTARLWDGRTGKSVGEPMNHGGYVDAVAFSPDGAIVLTASEDRTARLWDARTGKPLGPVMEHGGPILRSAYSPDGSTVLTGSEDGVARLWLVPRPIPARSILLSAAAASGMRLDDAGHLERLTDEQLTGLWRQVDTGGPDWLAKQARLDERKSVLWHRIQAAEAELGRNWFAAEFHLNWLSIREPTDAELIARLESVQLEVAKQGASNAAAISDKTDPLRAWHRKDGTSAEMKLIMIDGDEAKFILPNSAENRVKMDQLSDEDQAWIHNHFVEIEKRNLHNGGGDATRADDAAPLRFVRWHYDADERGISGDFRKRDSGWVEMKNNTTSPHAIFEEIARTTEHVELFDVGRHIWVRLQPAAAFFSQDGIKWHWLYAGVPVENGDSPPVQK